MWLPTLTAVQGWDEKDVVVWLNSVLHISEELPIGVVDQYQNAGPNRVARCEQLRSFLEMVVTQVANQFFDVPFDVRLQAQWQLLHVAKQQFGTTAKLDQNWQRHFVKEPGTEKVINTWRKVKKEQIRSLPIGSQLQMQNTWFESISTFDVDFVVCCQIFFE